MRKDRREVSRWWDSSDESYRSAVNSCEIGVLSKWGTAVGALEMAIAYSSSFFMYFFLGALSSNCKPSHYILLLSNLYGMSDPNYNTRPLYYYPHSDPPHPPPSQSYIRTNQDPFTPTHSRVEIAGTQFVPKIIESGYIVGPPVAYTQAPNLPPNFQAFSPIKPTVPIILDSSVRNDFVGSTSKVTISQPSHLYPV